MNKKILIIVVSVILVFGIIGSYFLFFFDKNAAGNGEPVSGTEEYTDNEQLITDKQWLYASSFSELESMVKISGNTLTYEQGYAYVSDLLFSNSKATYNYRIADDGSVKYLKIGHILVSSTEENETYTMENVSAEDLKNRLNIVLNWISVVFSVDIGESFTIYDISNNVLDNTDINSYERILNGEAMLELRMLDTDGSVWVLTSQQISTYNIISCELAHYMADSDEAILPCNVSFPE